MEYTKTVAACQFFIVYHMALARILKLDINIIPGPNEFLIPTACIANGNSNIISSAKSRCIFTYLDVARLLPSDMTTLIGADHCSSSTFDVILTLTSTHFLPIARGF